MTGDFFSKMIESICNVLFLYAFGMSIINTSTFEQELHTHLLQDYNSDVRPVASSKESIQISFQISLYQLVEMDERNQILSLKVWVRNWWNDVSLKWNPSEFDGIESVQIMSNKVWVPDITLYSDLREELIDIRSIYPIVVTHDGNVTWLYPVFLKAYCFLDIQFFPWDVQNCPLKFGSWTTDLSKLNLLLVESSDQSNFLVNGEWELIDFKGVRSAIKYDCCDSPFIDVTYSIILERKPLYYLFNLAIPCIFITCAALLTFCLPVQSGEKLTLSVTILLALTVFIQIVSDSLPPQSNCIPILSIFFGSCLILVAISLILTVIVIKIHHAGDIGFPVPNMLRTIVLKYISRLVCLKKYTETLILNDKNKYCLQQKSNDGNQTPVTEKKCNANTADHHIASLSNLHVCVKTESEHHERTKLNSVNIDEITKQLVQIKHVLELFVKNNEKEHSHRICEKEWILIASILDRFFFMISSAFACIIFISCLSVGFIG